PAPDSPAPRRRRLGRSILALSLGRPTSDRGGPSAETIPRPPLFDRPRSRTPRSVPLLSRPPSYCGTPKELPPLARPARNIPEGWQVEYWSDEVPLAPKPPPGHSRPCAA